MSAPPTVDDPAWQPMLLTLPSFTPTLALEVLPMGLTFHRLFVQEDGRTHDILIGPENPSDHLTQKYTNTIIGRYANRLPASVPLPLPVPSSSASLTTPATASTFTVPANESPTVSLHGGLLGFDLRPFLPLTAPSEATLFTPAEIATIESTFPPGSAAIYAREAEDGEEGYPGRLRIEVLVGLVQPQGKADAGDEWRLGSVLVVYRAKLLDDNKVTPINLTQHWGFNLDASLQKGQSIKEHTLSINADHTLELGPDFNATGTLLPVTGTHHAHHEKPSKQIGENFPEHGYDEFYVFSRSAPPPIPAKLSPEAFQPSLDLIAPALDADASGGSSLTGGDAYAVELSSAKSGLRLGFVTNQDGVQFYSNNFADPSTSSRKKIHGGSGAVGDGYEKASAAFLEFHAPLAAWLHPQIKERPGAFDTLLASGEVYNNYVRLDVWFRTPGPGADDA